MRDPHDIVYPLGSLFEVPDTDRGRWRQRQLARECIRVAMYTGECLEDRGDGVIRPIAASAGGYSSDPMTLRSLARYWGLTL